MKNKAKKAATLSMATLVVFFCLGLFTLPVLAEDGNVPQVVLDARNSVLRVVVEGKDFIAEGSGFAVGSEKQPYIITNNHVVEDGQYYYLFYDTGKYVEGKVYKTYPDQDLAVIKPLSPIKGLTILPLADKDVDSGLAVYALGFPGASDVLASGFEQQNFTTREEFLSSVVADKQSMTVTNGIISAIRNSKLIGSTNEEVKMVQTNTAINQGNSGGPLLNAQGFVVGINTIGLSGVDTIEAMNGSVHVDELLKLLKKDGVPFTVTQEGALATDGTGQAPAVTPQPDGANTMQNLMVGGGLLVFALAVLVIVLVALRSRKASPKREMGMLTWERGGFVMNEVEIQQKMMVFLQELLQLEASGRDVYALLSPENIFIGPKGISLKKKRKGQEDSGAIKLYPGYSAPESYDNRTSPASSVYFVGALMRLLSTGRRPENALRREEVKDPGAAQSSTLQEIISEAMALREEERGQGLNGLYYRLGNAGPAIQYENGYLQAQNYGGYYS